MLFAGSVARLNLLTFISMNNFIVWIVKFVAWTVWVVVLIHFAR